MGLEKLHREIKKRLPLPVYYIWAEDEFLLWDAYEKIKAICSPEDKELGLDIFDASEEGFSLDDVFDSLQSGGLFGSKRLVLLKRFEAIKNKREIKALIEYLIKPSDNTLVILSTKSPVKDLYKALKPYEIIELNLKDQEALKFIKEMAKLKGILIDDNTVKALMDLTEKNFGRIYWEIEKLSLAGYKQIDLDALEELVTGTMDFSPFKVGEALLERKKAKAFEPFAKTRERLDPFLFIGALNWQIRNAEKHGRITSERARKIYERLLSADISLKVSLDKYPIEIDILRLLSL